jgi:hypothetical protein
MIHEAKFREYQVQIQPPSLVYRASHTWMQNKEKDRENGWTLDDIAYYSRICTSPL